MADKKTHLFQNLKQQGSSDESARLYMCVTIHSGKAEIIVEKTITQRFPVEKYETAERLYERLTCGGGRRVYTLEDLASEKI